MNCIILAHLILGLLVFPARTAKSVESPSGENLPLILDRAGSTAIDIVDDLATVKWDGGVVLHQGMLHLSCDEALYRESEGMVDLTGHVFIDDREKERTLQARRVLYFFKGRHLTAETGVVLKDRGNRHTMRADEITYDRMTSFGEAYDNPLLTLHPDTAAAVNGLSPGDSDSITVRAGQFSFDLEEQVFIALNDVVIETGSVLATADYGEYHDEVKVLFLDGSPRIEREEGDEITGDRMEIRLNDGRDAIAGVVVLGNGESVHPLQGSGREEEKVSRLRGDFMDIVFRDGEIRSVGVEGDASSLYYPPEDREANHRDTSNELEGDAILIEFDDDEIDRVFVTGNVTGSYSFRESRPSTGEW